MFLTVYFRPLNPLTPGDTSEIGHVACPPLPQRAVYGSRGASPGEAGDAISVSPPTAGQCPRFSVETLPCFLFLFFLRVFCLCLSMGWCA